MSMNQKSEEEKLVEHLDKVRKEKNCLQAEFGIETGLSKREQFALAALRVLLAREGHITPQWAAASAVEYADALLGALYAPPLV